MRFIATLLVSALVLMAGCLDSDSNNDTPEPTMTADPEPTMGMPDNFNGTGSVDRSVGTPLVSFGQGAGGAFTLSDNATIVFAEMKWESSDSLSLALDSPDGSGGNDDTFEYSNDSTSSPQNLTVTSGDAGENWVGEWRLTAFAEGVVAGASYDWAVTVFYGETSVPAGYTAFGNATAEA